MLTTDYSNISQDPLRALRSAPQLLGPSSIVGYPNMLLLLLKVLAALQVLEPKLRLEGHNKLQVPQTVPDFEEQVELLSVPKLRLGYRNMRLLLPVAHVARRVLAPKLTIGYRNKPQSPQKELDWAPQ